MMKLSGFLALLTAAFVGVSADQACLNLGGNCLDYRNYFCTAGYQSGLCDGDNNRKCCLPCDQACLDQENDWSQSDRCEGGKCQMDSNYCDGSYTSGLCGGPSSRKCCRDAGCPRIVSRSEWGARAPTSTTPMSTPVSYVAVHHTESGGCEDQTTCSGLVRVFQDFHMDSNGWSDIGYSFLIGGDGNVYEGRGWQRVGAHTPGYNSRGLGISMIGSFMTSLPNQNALETLDDLIACGVAQGYITSGYSVIGHRQASATDCPGDRLYQYVQTMQGWNPAPSK